MPALTASALHPPLCLVDDHEIGLADRAIDAANRLGGQRLNEGQRRGHELKGLLQQRQRAVRGPVVDDDEFARLVVEREQGAEALDNRQLLVVGGHDDRDERRHRDAVGEAAGAPRVPQSMPPQRRTARGLIAICDTFQSTKYAVIRSEKAMSASRKKDISLGAWLPQHLAREQAANVLDARRGPATRRRRQAPWTEAFARP